MIKKNEKAKCKETDPNMIKEQELMEGKNWEYYVQKQGKRWTRDAIDTKSLPHN